MPGAEHPRPRQENRAAFFTGLPQAAGGNGERRENPFSLDKPVDLVGNIRALIQQERVRQGENFNAAWFLRNEMKSLMSLSPKYRPLEQGLFFSDLRIAWQLVAYGELEGYRDEVYGDIQIFGDDRRSIKLDPLGVTLLDAMAEAIGIGHTPGQDTFDISLFSMIETTARIRRGQVPVGHLYPVPTSEEVRNAITPKKTT